MTKARSIAHNQVSVGTSATKIAGSNGRRTKITITNAGAVAVFIGGSSVTAASGHSVAPGGVLAFDAYLGDVFGVVASGTATVSYLEEYDSP